MKSKAYRIGRCINAKWVDQTQSLFRWLNRQVIANKKFAGPPAHAMGAEKSWRAIGHSRSSAAGRFRHTAPVAAQSMDEY